MSHVVLRDNDPGLGPETVLVHMGEGNPARLLTAAVNSYDGYRELRSDGFGHFALSVFAVSSGFSLEYIVRHLPWKQYATCRAADLREFVLLPTMVLEGDFGDIDELQYVHFDVLLADLPDDRLRVPDALADDELDPGLLTDVEAALTPRVERFCQLFSPRQLSGDL